VFPVPLLIGRGPCFAGSNADLTGGRRYGRLAAKSIQEAAYGHHLDHHHRLCGGADREIPSSGPERAVGLLGIVGAVLATYIGQAIGWYKAGEGAGLIGAVVGALIVLVIWGMVSKRTA